MRLRPLTLLLMLCWWLPLASSTAAAAPGQLIQGSLLRGQVAAGTRVYYGDRQLKVSPDGYFILGFGRDSKAQQSLTLVDRQGKTRVEQLAVSPRRYQIQRIDGISKRLMQPNAEDLRRIRREAAATAAARAIDSDLEFFRETFIWPLKGKITGVYGSQRIFNGEPRRPHFGLDIAAPSGTPVVAPADGVVSLAHPGMFFSGRTLIIDHGHGLSSSFLHLSRILVKPGQQVRQGQQIATVGASGRVTGPHLDWRINWFDRHLDPALFVPTRGEPATGQSIRKF